MAKTPDFDPGNEGSIPSAPTKIVTLREVPALTTQEEIRLNVVEKLKRVLVQAEAGEIDEILVIMHHPDEDWTSISSMTQSIMRWVGYLEMTKLDWVDKYKKFREDNES